MEDYSRPPGKWTDRNMHKGHATTDNFATVKRTGILHSENIDKRREAAEDAGVSYEEISLMDINDPLSVVSLATPIIREAIKRIPPDAWSMSFDNLERRAKITDLDGQTRLAFWDEYALSQDQKKKMNLSNVARISTRSYFYETFLNNPYKVAYLLTPPQKYQYKMREMLDMAHRRMREVLTLPLTHKGQPNTKLIAEMVKIAVLLENRVMGAVSQKLQVETKSLNVNVSAERKSYFSVEEEIKAVEKQLKDLRSGGNGLLDFSAETFDGEREISVGDSGDIGEITEAQDGTGAGETPEGT